jgi:hypothetical protein
MSEHDSIADRAKREVDALDRLRKDSPRLFYMVVVALVLVGLGFVYDRFLGIPKLREELQERDRRIVLLETQLAPFRALAIDRFPGQAEGEALAKLATQIDELRRKFEAAQNAIQRFSAQLTVRVEGQWASGEPPDLSRLLRRAGAGNDVRVVFQLSQNRSRELELGVVDELRLSKESDQVVNISYAAEAASGSWVYELHREDFAACNEMHFPLYGFSADSTTDGRLNVQSIRLTFFINGRPKFSCEVSAPGQYRASEGGYDSRYVERGEAHR